MKSGEVREHVARKDRQPLTRPRKRYTFVEKLAGLSSERLRSFQ